MYTTTTEFLDLVKARHGLSSDYALADKLGLTRSMVSAYRNGKRMLGEEPALRVAALLDLDPGYVLACMEAERTRSAAARAAWERLADRLKTLGPVALVLFVAGPAVGMVSSGARLLGEAVCILCQIRPVTSRRTWCNNPGDAFAAPA